MGFSRQEHWSGLPCPPPGHLPDPGIKPRSPELANRLFTTEPAGKPYLSWFVLTDAFIILIFKKKLFIFFLTFILSPCAGPQFFHIATLLALCELLGVSSGIYYLTGD